MMHTFTVYRSLPDELLQMITGVTRIAADSALVRTRSQGAAQPDPRRHSARYQPATQRFPFICVQV